MLKTKYNHTSDFCGSSFSRGEKEFEGTTIADVMKEIKEYLKLGEGKELKNYAKVYVNRDYLNEHSELETDNRKAGLLFYEWESFEAPRFTIYTTDYCEHLGLSF